MTTAAIDNALYNAFGQRLISTIYTQSNQYRVVLEVQPEFQGGPAALNDIYVVSSAGEPVRLSAIARISERATPLVINHLGQFPSTTISFNLARGSSLGHAVNAIRAAEAELGLPVSVRTRFQGAALAFQSSLSNTLLLILAAIVTMYIVLGVLYESYIHPVTILSTLPSAGVGALLALLLSGTDLGIVAVIGIILLIGIVKKNAIMMIDFALDAERERRQEPARGDFPGVPAALPADPDDDHGGAARGAAADARHRRRLRAAPSARHHHGGRAAREPGAHALHHAGDLSRVRSPLAPHP